jgi:hypothetical protein
MKTIDQSVRYFLSACLFIVLGYIGVIAFPQPMFTYHTSHQNYEVWSDKPIPPQIAQVLDDATRRLTTSDLYDKNSTINIFFCNASWRLWLYGQHFSDQVGANADSWLTRNVYIRASDIAHNRIYSPSDGPIADADQRPLSYFIAHEATHVIVSRQFGRLVSVRYPLWLREGYADYIGKGGDFDFNENYRLFRTGSPLMDFQKSGLYRGFHLDVSLLLDKKGLTARQIFANPPSAHELSDQLENYVAP